MPLSRRGFLRSATIAAAASAVLELPALALPVQVEAAHRGDIPPNAIKLSNNENAYGPSPKSLAAMQMAVAEGNRYPDRYNHQLVEGIAAFHKVAPERVLLGCGSMDILRAATGAFLGPGKALIIPQPTFEAIAEYSQPMGAQTVRVPLDRTYAHDLDAMLASAAKQPSLIYVCNPNNPTASLTPRKAIEASLAKFHPQSVILIDEAYHHFALSSPDYLSFLDKPVHDGRIVVARTFSKIFGLAGMRMGYAIAEPELARRMGPYALPDNLNVVAAEVGSFALKDLDGLAAAIKRNAADRDAFQAQAKQRGIKFIPSAGNFVMIDTGKPIRPVIQHFRQHNIAIGRPFPPLETHARISLGTPPEMQSFWNAWDQMKG